eukprot:1136362-Pelagomonas_calceolata.AAC.8
MPEGGAADLQWVVNTIGNEGNTHKHMCMYRGAWSRQGKSQNLNQNAVGGQIRGEFNRGRERSSTFADLILSLCEQKGNEAGRKAQLSPD